MFAAVGDDRVQRQARACAEHEVRMHRLAPLLVRDAEHGDVDDVRMLFQDGLDLRRIDVHSAGDDHVLLAIADVEEALFVEIRDVADGLPATFALVRFELLLGLV